MKHGSLFSGMGGFDLAAEWMGWENVFHCEWNKFNQKILKHYWPDAKSYDDITKTDFSIHRGTIDIITGGFPCQPYSQAGKRKGKEDERHLWPEMRRAIREVQPSWVVGENVPGLLNWNRGMVLHEIKTDLESEGFEVFPPCVLPACSVNAPHRRDRLWIIAHARHTKPHEWKAFEKGQQFNGRGNARSESSSHGGLWNVTDTSVNGCEVGGEFQIREEIRFAKSEGNRNRRENWISEPGVRGVANGIPNRVDRLRSLGNAIVPQVAYEIFKAIEATEKIIK